MAAAGGCPHSAAGPARDMCRGCWGHWRWLPTVVHICQPSQSGREVELTPMPAPHPTLPCHCPRKGKDQGFAKGRGVRAAGALVGALPGAPGSSSICSPRRQKDADQEPPEALRLICSRGVSRRRHSTGWGGEPATPHLQCLEIGPAGACLEMFRCSQGSLGRRVGEVTSGCP